METVCQINRDGPWHGLCPAQVDRDRVTNQTSLDDNLSNNAHHGPLEGVNDEQAWLYEQPFNSVW